MKEPIPKRTKHFYSFGPFRLYVAERELFRGAEAVDLPPKALDTLLVLVSHRGHVVDKDELMKTLWPDTFVEEDSLVQQISHLRKALGEGPDGVPYIETIARRGYRFAACVAGSWEEEPAEPRLAVAGSSEEAKPVGRRRRLLTVSFAAPWVLLVVALGIIVAMWLRGPTPSEPAPLRRFAFTPDEEFTTPVISPSGRHIAYVTALGAESKLWVQDLDRDEPRQLESAAGAVRPFWSLDSEFIGFAVGSELKRVPVEGGPAITLCRVSGFSRGTWNPDGSSILFSAGTPIKIYEVPARGGSPEVFLEPEPGEGLTFSRPHFLPCKTGPLALAFVEGQIGYRFFGGPKRNIVIQNLETGRRHTLVRSAGWPVYSPTGHILYEKPGVSGYSVWALPISLDTLLATGEAFPVAENAVFPSVANDGTLAYMDYLVSGQVQLVWRDRSGQELRVIGQLQRETSAPVLSPDGRLVAISVLGDIWIHDIGRTVWTRFIFSSADDAHPVWSPTGEEIAYSYRHSGQSDIYIKRVDGSGEAKALLATTDYEDVCDWSLDGKYLLYEVYDPENGWDLWYLERNADGKGYDPHPFLETPFHEDAGRFSPDGRFVAYCSNESGQVEVYVRPFPEGGARWQISRAGGAQIRWRRDGKEIIYIEGDTLIAVAVSTRPSFTVGRASRLFRHQPREYIPPYAAASDYRQYDVSADGQQFLVGEPVEVELARKPSIHVVQNWFAEFRDRR